MHNLPVLINPLHLSAIGQKTDSHAPNLCHLSVFLCLAAQTNRAMLFLQNDSLLLSANEDGLVVFEHRHCSFKCVEILFFSIFIEAE